MESIHLNWATGDGKIEISREAEGDYSKRQEHCVWGIGQAGMGRRLPPGYPPYAALTIDAVHGNDTSTPSVSTFYTSALIQRRELRKQGGCSGLGSCGANMHLGHTCLQSIHSSTTRPCGLFPLEPTKCSEGKGCLSSVCRSKTTNSACRRCSILHESPKNEPVFTGI